MSSAVRSEKVAEKIYRISDSIYRLGPLGEPKVLSSYLIIDDKVSIVDCGPSAEIGRKAKIRVSKKSDSGRRLLQAFREGKQVRVQS